MPGAAEAAAAQAASAVEAVFASRGPLGVVFVAEGGWKRGQAVGAVRIKQIKPGSAAAQLGLLGAGMTLVRLRHGVVDLDTSRQPYDDVIQAIRAASRPLTLNFAAAPHGYSAAAEAPDYQGSPARNASGALSEGPAPPVAAAGSSKLVRLEPGGQRSLRRTDSVDSQSAQAEDRGLRRTDSVDSESPVDRLPPAEPSPEQLAPEQAAAALRLHIAQHGTADVSKINRLRRASMAQGQPGHRGPQQPQMSQVELMAAAAAAEENVATAPAGGTGAWGGEVQARFEKPGTLGLKFTALHPVRALPSSPSR